MKQLKHTENTCHLYFLDLLLPFCFLAIWGNLYMIHLYLNLLYKDYNTMHQHYHRQIHFLSLILLTPLDIFAKKFKKILNNFICFTTHHNFYIITFCMHSSSLIRIFRKNKVNCHCQLNFPLARVLFSPYFIT